MKNSLAYLFAPLVAWLVAQTAKDVLGAVSQKKGGVTKYFRSGGMPSAHTATVVALASVIFFHEGVSSLFAIAAWLAAITVYDALVARRSIGEQGLSLIKLLRDSKYSKDPLPAVALGHKPLEVIVGAFIGGITGYVVALFITF